MLRAYYLEDGQIRAVAPTGPELRLPARTLWLDLYEPSEAEEDAVERALGIDVPTREEMKEIEASSRLYREDGALFMTATLVTNAETEAPESSAITFILAGERLVTVRYADPLPFRAFATYALRHPGIAATAMRCSSACLRRSSIASPTSSRRTAPISTGCRERSSRAAPPRPVAIFNSC
jgi:magnesium transporter